MIIVILVKFKVSKVIILIVNSNVKFIFYDCSCNVSSFCF